MCYLMWLLDELHNTQSLEIGECSGDVDESTTFVSKLTMITRKCVITVVHRVSAHGRLLLEAEKSGGGRLHA